MYEFAIVKSWFLFQLPLIVLYALLLTISHYFQKYHFKDNLIPNPFIKKLYQLDAYIIKEVCEKMPEDLLEWVNPHLDKQTKEEYMKALTPSTIIRHVCKQDLENTKKNPEEKKNETVFLLKPLTVSQQANLRDNMYKVQGVGRKRKEMFQTGTSEVDALVLGLVGWENFKNEAGADVTFDKNNVPAMLEMIPADARSELATKVRGEAEIDEGEG